MVDLASSAVQLVDSIIEMPSHFLEVALHDPINIVLLAFGVLFVAGASAAFGYLSLGAFFSLFTVDSTPPPESH